MGRVAGEIDAHTAGAAHAAGQFVGKRDDRQIGIPAKAVAQAAASQGIAWRAEAGAGHGVGTAESEPPYFTPDDATPLQAGMVVAVDVWSYGPQQELIHSVNTYEITAEGSRLLSWYKVTERLYAITGFRSTH